MAEAPGSSKIPPRLRRIILLAAGGALAGALVVTAFGAVPRPVDVEVAYDRAQLAGRESYTVITADGQAAVEIRETVAGEGGPAHHRFWLSPEPHRIEIRVRGCPPIRRTFNPKDVGRLALSYACEAGP